MKNHKAAFAKSAQFTSIVVLLLLILIYPEVSRESVVSAFKSAVLSVIPSLFPFMVLTKIMLDSGTLSFFEGSLGKLCRRLFKLPPEASGPLIIGFISGFPLGAKSACDLYKKRSIAKEDAESIMALSNNTGPAFIISAAGALYWGSKTFGIMIYIFQILSVMLTGLILFRSGPARRTPFYNNKNVDDVKVESFSSIFTQAISSSALSCVNIAAYIAFFKAITGIILQVTSGSNQILSAVLSSLLEFSSGVAAASRAGGIFGVGLTGFAIGFGGISVIAQTASYAQKAGLSVKKCIWFKFIEGIICGFLCIIAVQCDKSIISTGAYVEVMGAAHGKICVIITIAIVIVALVKKLSSLLSRKAKESKY